MLNRRALTASLIASPFIIKAQGAYPNNVGTIKVVVPYPAGGTTDIVGRVFAERLSKLWNVPTIVENIAGAGATVGMDRVAKGPQDGSTILIVPPNITTNEFLYSSMPFNPANDITFLGQMVRFPNLLSFRKNLELNSVKDLIDFAKKNPNKLTFASSGVGTTIHLSGAMFLKMADVQMVHIPYRGSGPAINDLVGGQVDLMFDNIPSIIPQVRGGTVKGIAVTSAQRSQTASDFPTVADTLPGFEATSWFGTGVRSGTPKEICDRIEAVTMQMCKEPEVIERFAKLHADTVGSNAVSFTKHVVDERKKWGDLIKEMKIKAE